MTITASFNFSYQEWSVATRFIEGRRHPMGATYHIRDDTGQQKVLLVLMRALLIKHQWFCSRFFIDADIPWRRSGGGGVDAVNIDFRRGLFRVGRVCNRAGRNWGHLKDSVE